MGVKTLWDCKMMCVTVLTVLSGGPLPGLQVGEFGPAWQQHHRSLSAGPPPSSYLPAQAGPQRPRQPLHVGGVPLQGGTQEAGICFSCTEFDRSRKNFE